MNWSAAFGGDGGDVCFQSQNPMKILGETQNNGIYRSLNGGTGWSSATNGLSGSGTWVGPIVSHPDSADMFYTARTSVFKTTNAGANWFAISSGISGTIREMAISKSNPSVMFATTGAPLYKSTDGGYTWALVSSGLPNRVITSVYVHPDSSDVGVVCYSGFGSGKVFRTANGGATWVDISGNLPDTPINDVLIYHPGFSTSTYLAATDVGVFITNNYGATWTELADGLPNTVAIHLDYNESANKIRVATHGRGVYETSLTTGVINYTNDRPRDFKLLQNYPNPFNPTTNITYFLSSIREQGRAAEENISLKVYDVLGKEVATLVNEVQKPGTYTVRWDASDLASGIYYLRLNAGAFVQTRKLVLTK
jgi:photosystem II stability/assembly factor-like uncharacterized protein